MQPACHVGRLGPRGGLCRGVQRLGRYPGSRKGTRLVGGRPEPLTLPQTNSTLLSFKLKQLKRPEPLRRLGGTHVPAAATADPRTERGRVHSMGSLKCICNCLNDGRGSTFSDNICKVCSEMSESFALAVKDSINCKPSYCSINE